MTEAGWTRETCVETLWPAGAWPGHKCGKKGKVQHEGKWYCGIHSPEAKAKRKAKMDAADAERAARWKAVSANAAYSTAATDACRALGIIDPAKELPALAGSQRQQGRVAAFKESIEKLREREKFYTEQEAISEGQMRLTRGLQRNESSGCIHELEQLAQAAQDEKGVGDAEN